MILLVLAAALIRRGVSISDICRVTMHSNDFRGAACPYLASVRVDSREIYRVHEDPNELFREDVLEDLERALRSSATVS